MIKVVSPPSSLKAKPHGDRKQTRPAKSLIWRVFLDHAENLVVLKNQDHAGSIRKPCCFSFYA